MIELNNIEETPTHNRLALLKLVSGEEVVAELYRDPENKEAWMLHKPYTLIEMATQHGFGLVMRPFFRSLQPSFQENISVDMKHIITMADVPAALQKAYLQQSSGIDLTSNVSQLHKPS